MDIYKIHRKGDHRSDFQNKKMEAFAFFPTFLRLTKNSLGRVVGYDVFNRREKAEVFVGTIVLKKIRYRYSVLLVKIIITIVKILIYICMHIFINGDDISL